MGSPSQGRSYKLVGQCQMVIPENIHTSNIIWNNSLYLVTSYMHAITKKKRGHEFAGEWEELHERS